MTTHTIACPRPPSLRLLAILTLPALAPAQIDGHFVVAAFTETTGPGGLWFVHPRQPSAPIPVTGLPASLIGQSPGAGAFSMLRRPGDDALFVGETQWGGSPVLVHEVHLNGTGYDALTSRSFVVGTAAAAFGGSVSQCAFDTNGDLLFGVWGLLSAPPLNGSKLGRLTPAGVITPVTMVPVPPGAINALAVDAQRGVAYLGMVLGGTLATITFRVHELNLATGATTLIHSASAPDHVYDLAVDGPGDVVLGTLNRLDRLTLGPGGWSYVPGPVTSSTVVGVGIERATGMTAVAYGKNPVTSLGSSEVAWATPGGAVTMLTSGPAGGWGVLSGIAVNDDSEPFGHGCPTGAHAFTQRSASGLPQIGNLGFGLQWASQVTPVASLLLLSTGRTSQSLFGCELYPDLAGAAVASFLLTGLGQQTFPLPIPAVNGLAGFEMFGQTIHLTAGGNVETSDGLQLTVLP